MDITGNNDIFSAGDIFNISGSYDTIGQQPLVETKGNGMVMLQDQALFGYTIDYSSIATLTSDIPIAAINNNYPSAGSGTVMGFNDDDIKNGSYFTDSNLIVSALSLDIFSDYTHLFLQKSQGTFSGFLNFNYRETSETTGDFTTYNWVNDSINLNVTSFQTSGASPAVPEPATMLLLGIGLAGLAGIRFGRKKW